ncbi:MAG: AraC family transcriptional regulator [Myxococcota bacterium]
MYVGPGLDLSPHKNAAATIAIGLEFPFELAFAATGIDCLRPRNIALIPPGSVHHLKAGGALVFVYLDALSDDYKSVRADALEASHSEVVAELGEVLDNLDRISAPGAVIEQIFSVLAIAPRPSEHQRLTATIRAIDRAPQDFSRVEDAAQHAGLSVSRFQHIFRDEVGMPFRRYRLWKRMAVVATAIEAGRSLTGAALDAGFASSAHLSVTFREMFGLAPSRLIAAGTRFEIAA